MDLLIGRPAGSSTCPEIQTFDTGVGYVYLCLVVVGLTHIVVVELYTHCRRQGCGSIAVAATCSSSVHVLIGEHLIKAVVGTQTVPALSSGEAEFLAIVKAGSLSLGIRSMAADFGDKGLDIEIGTDSSAAKGILGRIGLGRVRHLDTGL